MLLEQQWYNGTTCGVVNKYVRIPRDVVVLIRQRSLSRSREARSPRDVGSTCHPPYRDNVCCELSTV